MSNIHKKEFTKKATGVILLKKYRPSDKSANTFTKIIMIRSSFCAIK